MQSPKRPYKTMQSPKRPYMDIKCDKKHILAITMSFWTRFSFANIFCSFCNIFCSICNKFCSRTFLFLLEHYLLMFPRLQQQKEQQKSCINDLWAELAVKNLTCFDKTWWQKLYLFWHVLVVNKVFNDSLRSWQGLKFLKSSLNSWKSLSSLEEVFWKALGVKSPLASLDKFWSLEKF